MKILGRLIARSNTHQALYCIFAFIVVSLTGCSMMTGAGPSSRAVNGAKDGRIAEANINIIDVTDSVARRIVDSNHAVLFSEILGDGYPVGSIVGKGDVLDIAIWEAPPAALFGSMGGDPSLTSLSSAAHGTSLPTQMVNSDGMVTIPFVGALPAAGRTLRQLEHDIASRLSRMAHEPQVVVRLLGNASSNVTIVGDVANSARVPLTARGERLLDILAAAGGVKQPVGKMTIQITRGDKVTSLPLETVIRDPRQNIRLQPDDVVTAFYQPYSFTALGATGRNEELPFESTGITLAQALGRVAGLQDQRADVKGVFIFRLEDPSALDSATRQSAKTTPDGKVPIIYRINMKDPATFFIAQSFSMRNKDVLYISNAPLADVQKFVNVISSTIFPLATAATVLP
ncbi:MAG: polysaccharide biosynthesis/export family protein [Sphingobium sp.]